ncbi:hypothetical protein Tco_1006192 [Tanacetum coccineum]|uniref:Retrotransposon gag domain-containing protein n=1 Tax=Tanacetum coccineum TaxID=301880 RepID=A0ABQ5FI54_9ASTR
MPPKRRTTRATPVVTTTPTTTVTDAQLQALIDRGVAATLVERDASRSRDGDNSHGSEIGRRRQVKYASCTLQGSALMWWNSHVKAVGQDVAYAMPWMALKRMITDKYCPKGEIKKLEYEMFPEESAKVERYVGGLLDMIHGSVKASKTQSMQEANEFATEMMDKKMLYAAYTTGPGDKKPYGGTKPLCTVTPRQGGNARRKQEWISSQHMVSL